MRKLICIFSLIIFAAINLAARADSFTYTFTTKGSIIGAGGSSTYVFTEPYILTTDTVIPIADITIGGGDQLFAFEINPASPGTITLTSYVQGVERVSKFPGALTSTGTFISTEGGVFAPYLTIAESPVPEPFSLLLLGTGALGFLNAIIRQKKTEVPPKGLIYSVLVHWCFRAPQTAVRTLFLPYHWQPEVSQGT